jgi:hypothetical protein
LVKSGDVVALYDKRRLEKKQAFIGIVKNHGKTLSPYFHIKKGSDEDCLPGRNNAPYRLEIKRWFGQPRYFSLPRGLPWPFPLVQITPERLDRIAMGRNLRKFLRNQLKREGNRPASESEPSSDNEDQLTKRKRGNGWRSGHGWRPEGREHEKLKEWVYNHPEFLGVRDPIRR